MKGEFDRYDSVHPDGGSRCPWCGKQIDPQETVVTVDGRKGWDASLASAGFLHIRTYHPRCLKKRRLVKRRVQNKRLSEFERA